MSETLAQKRRRKLDEAKKLNEEHQRNFRDRKREFNEFIGGSEGNLRRNAADEAARIAPARMGLLGGKRLMQTQGSVEHSLRVYRGAKASFNKLQKEKREKELWERQGEANTGGLPDYGFKFTAPSDPGILPRHDLGKPHKGEQDPAWAHGPHKRGYDPHFNEGDQRKFPSWHDQPRMRHNISFHMDGRIIGRRGI